MRERSGEGNGSATVRRRGFVAGLSAGLAGSACLAAAACSRAPASTGAKEKGGPLKWKTTSHDPTAAADYKPFLDYCANVAELSEGQLILEPHGPGEIAPVGQMFDGLRDGKIDLLRIFPTFANFIPGTSFLTSYPLGLDRPDQWEAWYYSLGGLEIARRIFEPYGVRFVGPLQHDLNIIHSHKPLRSFADFRGLKLRMPGGLIAEVFDAAGAKTVLLSGDQVYPALSSGKIDAADFSGPATNYNLGLANAARYVVVGPPSTPCIHQPVDLQCVLVNQDRWNALPKHLQQVVEYATRRFSWDQYAHVQQENTLAWPKYRAAGVETIRLSEADVLSFRRVAIPLWFKYARANPLAREAFASQLEYMKNPAVAYLTDDMLVDGAGKPLTL